MPGRDQHSSRLIHAAVADFVGAADAEDLWLRLNRHLLPFGITGSLFGTEALPDPGRDLTPRFNSCDPVWLAAKMDGGLLQCDEYVRAARCETRPILWGDTSRIDLPEFSQAAWESLAVDYDFGVLTGVTIPMHFAGGLGVSSIGCHARALSWAEFDRIWLERGRAIVAIVNSFDVALRRAHIGDLFPLSARERDCLAWLAAGLQQQQIADRLNLSDRQVETSLAHTRAKLRALTNAQALATALVYGLLEP